MIRLADGDGEGLWLLVEEWLAVETEQGRASATIDTRRQAMRAFVDALADVAPEVRSWKEVTPRHFRGVLAAWQRQGHQGSTRALRFSITRTFARWLTEAGEIGGPFTRGVKPPRVPLKIPRTLLEWEIGAMVLTCDPSTALGARDAAMLELMYASGLRKGEVVAITVDDLRLDDEEPRVLVRRGKGGDQRWGLLHDRAVASLRHWLRFREETGPTTRHLWVKTTGKGRGGPRGAPVTHRAVTQAVQRAAKAAGITRLVSCHDIRRSLGTHLADHGVDVPVIAEVLGHKSWGQVTQRYVNTARRLRPAYKRGHPRAK